MVVVVANTGLHCSLTEASFCIPPLCGADWPGWPWYLQVHHHAQDTGLHKTLSSNCWAWVDFYLSLLLDNA